VITKKMFTILTLILFFVAVFAGKVNYEDSLGPQGLTLSQSSVAGASLNFSINEFTLSEKTINEELRDILEMPGVFLPNEAGAPNLPGISRYIAIPQGATATYTIKATREVHYYDLDIAPAPVIPIDSDDSPLVYEENPEIYTVDAFYPSSPVMISEPLKIRGLDVVTLGITPFQYNPVTKELIVYRDIEIEVSFTGGNGKFGEDRLRNRHWDRILKSSVINRAILGEIDYNRVKSPGEYGYEYIIICPSDEIFIEYANKLKDFRTKQGISTIVKPLSEIEGGNTFEGIKYYISKAWDNWDIKPSAVLLLADWGAQGTPGTIYSPTYKYTFTDSSGNQHNYTCVSDNFYADIDNEDGKGLPEITISRMTAQNEEHLRTMIDKIVSNETAPPYNPGFYNHPITSVGWQTDRWFQISGETVGGFTRKELGKTPVRINEHAGNDPDPPDDKTLYNPNVIPNDCWSNATNTAEILEYFGPNGLGYIPENPGDMPGGALSFTGGDASDIKNAINNGSFMALHRGHGNKTKWGQPRYTVNDISLLTNSELPFIFSINCLTGKFDWTTECFAEKFHRHTYDGSGSGALGVISASGVSWSFVNDTYVWGMFDYFWPDFMPDYEGDFPSINNEFLPAFGSVYGKYFLDQSSWPYNTDNKKDTYYLFHMHGCAYTQVYTEMPQFLTVNYDRLYAGQNSFSVSADPGAVIALVANGEIIGKGTGTGFANTIQIEPLPEGTQVFLTVTKQNYYRYETEFVVNSISMASEGKKYAILLAGDYTAANVPSDQLWNGGQGNYSEFWNDLFLQWETLYNSGYDKENIIILFANGKDMWQDVNYTLTSTQDTARNLWTDIPERNDHKVPCHPYKP
jgi:hypothetical protein